MNLTFARIKAILSSIVFWAVLASTVISQVLDEVVASEFNDDLATVVEWGGSALAVLALAIASIRRVTGVLPDQVGLVLPPEASGTGFVMHRAADGDTTKTPVT